MRTIQHISIKPWSLPLVAPFRVAKRVSHVASNILIRIETDDKIIGIGAAAPVEYVTGETESTVLTSLNTLSEQLMGMPTDRLMVLTTLINDVLRDQPSARAAAEMAVLDLWAHGWQLPLWQFYGGLKSSLCTDITVPIVSPEEARTIVHDARAEGFNTFKIKIGGSDGHEADLARVSAVVESAPGCGIRIDANQAFLPDEAVKFVKQAQALTSNIQLVEQPVAKDDFTGLKYVKEHIDLPLFADESARSYSDVSKLIAMDAVDGINIKLMKSAIIESVDIVQLCRNHGKALMIGCMLESPLGIAAAAAIAAGIGGFDYIDLDSYRLLKPVECLTGKFATNGPEILLDPIDLGWGVRLDSEPNGTNS